MAYDRQYITDRVAIMQSGCWIWRFAQDRYGYGQVSLRSGESLAHRLAYRIFKEPPGALKVCHSCDVPACCNPEHLFLGTQGDNIRDAARKGKMKKPSKVPAELLPRLVELVEEGRVQQKDLAKHFNLSDSRMSTILSKYRKETTNG